MSNFVPPMPGEPIFYICTKCKNRFSHKIPKSIFGMIKPKVKCPSCGGRAMKDPAIMY